jgi:hypothetical protein
MVLPHENPFAEIDWEREFPATQYCGRCGKVDHLIGAKPGDVVTLRVLPNWPMFVCICGYPTAMVDVRGNREGQE